MFSDVDSDKFYNDEPPEFVEAVEQKSSILEDCINYTASSFNSMISSKNVSQNFSTFFMNIDGNNSNFDSLVTELKQINHNFSVIGLAETNINCSDKNLFSISDEYDSVYQSKMEDKNKGSGVGLYVHKKYKFAVNETLSMCTEDIESLFIDINDAGSTSSSPRLVGVLYRPPNGNINKFNSEIQDILDAVHDCGAYILGDFNINLHNLQSSPPDSHHLFQYPPTPTLCQNLYRQHSHKYCRFCVGLRNYGIEYFEPFCCFPVHEPNNKKSPVTEISGKITIHYEYYSSNIAKFCTVLKRNIENHQTDIDNFASFN